MKIFKKVSVPVIVLSIILALGCVTWILTKDAKALGTAVSLGSADNFSVLAGSAIADSNPSVVSGDVGLSPSTGAGIDITDPEVAGTIYDVDGAGPTGSVQDAALLTTAKNDLTSAYNNAEGQASDTAVLASTVDSFSGTGYTLVPGVYTSGSTMGITGTLTLDGGGDPNAVFVFQAGSSLTTASSSDVVLINGAQACNVFWQVTSSATLGTGTTFAGNILALTSITDNSGSTVEGRLLARNGAVTLDDTTITEATCVAPAGGSSSIVSPVHPLINVTKIPSPLNLNAGPGSVTFNYVVTNIGEIEVSDVEVEDNKCESIRFIDGDENDDSILDLEEEWTYRCTKTVNRTETNTVTVCGDASNGSSSGTVCDTANATVFVGASITPPLIHLVKVPNKFNLPAGGGAVTYMYTVTNPGTEPLNNVSIIDDKCTGLPGRVAGNPGDLNHNDLLESNEAWSFTCLTNLTQTTTNLATAEGHANGLTAIDFANATVVVASPGLPKTGLAPFGGNMLHSILMLLGVLAFITGMMILIKKRKN